jgi:hypothetical protein
MSATRQALVVVTVALAMLAGWWLGRGLSPRTAAFPNLSALLLFEPVHLSWWSCPSSTSAGPNNIYVFSIPARLSYRIETGNLRSQPGKTGLVLRPADFQLVSVELPENYREALSAAALYGNAEPELAAELARARPIAGYLAAFLLRDPESPLRARLTQQVQFATTSAQGRVMPLSEIVWVAEDAARPQPVRNHQGPPFGIRPCPQRDTLVVDGVAYLMRPEGLLRTDRTAGLLARFGEVQLTPSLVAKAPELRQAVELMEGALQEHREAQQIVRRVNDEELAMMAEASALERYREANEAEYLAAMDAEDEARMREVEQKQLRLDEEHDQLQLQIDNIQQRQIEAAATATLASQQVRITQQYAQSVAQTHGGLAPATTADRGGSAYAGRLYLIEGYF